MRTHSNRLEQIALNGRKCKINMDLSLIIGRGIQLYLFDGTPNDQEYNEVNDDAEDNENEDGDDDEDDEQL